MRRKKSDFERQLVVIQGMCFIIVLLLMAVFVLFCVKLQKEQLRADSAYEVEREVVQTLPTASPDEESALAQEPEENALSLVMIADSYGSGFQGVGEQIDGWPNVLKRKLDLSEVSIEAIPGTGFINKEHGYRFDSMLVRSSWHIVHPDDVDYVLVGGGYNDWTVRPERMEEALELFVKQSRQLYPNATILLAPLGWDNYNPDARDSMDKMVIPAFEALDDKYEDVIYLQGSEHIMRQTDGRYFSEDGLHPNEEGQDAIATWFADWLKEQSIS